MSDLEMLCVNSGFPLKDIKIKKLHSFERGINKTYTCDSLPKSCSFLFHNSVMKINY